MYLQVCRDYASLPDPRTLTNTEIRFYYEGLRKELKQATSPKNKPKAPRTPATPQIRRRRR